METRGQRVKQKDDDKKIESIKDPAQDSRTDGKLPT
jgi:hypothetical protein